MRILNQNITSHPLLRRVIFSSVFLYCFFRRQIYEAIAAIFRQSDSYVVKYRTKLMIPIKKL